MPRLTSVVFFLTAVAGPGLAQQTTLTGGYTGGGPVYCDASDTTTGQETYSGSLVANPQPSLSSLAAAGGAFSGTITGSGGLSSSCVSGEITSQAVSGTISGTVSPGGAVSWGFQVSVLFGSGGTGNYSGSGGTGSTSMLTYNGTIDNSDAPSPGSLSIVLSSSGSGGGGSTAPPLQIPGGGGSSQVALPGATVGTSYSQNLSAAGGTAPYAWSLTGGSLPSGLTLASNGFFSGTPTQAGGAVFTAQVTDATGAFASSTFGLTVAPQPITITTTSLPNGIVGTPYPPQVLTASGGASPYKFQVNGLPGGLTFSNGAISGTPTAAGSFNLTVSVSDSSSPPLTGSAQLSLTTSTAHTDLVLSQNSVTFTVPNGASDLPVAAQVTVQSNTPAQPIGYTVSVTPAVPWLSVQSGGTTPGALNIGLTPQALQLTSSAQTSVVVTCGANTFAATSPCAGNAQTIAVKLNITTAAPQLVVTTPSLAFIASSANPQPVAQTFGLANRGGGSIFVNSLTAGDSFVSFVGGFNSLEGGPASYIEVVVNPAGLAAGLHQSSLSVVTSLGAVTVPVTVLVTANANLTLNNSGTLFNALAGSLPGNPNGSFEVGVTGGSTVSFTATELPGANWLTLNTTSGTSTPANPGLVNFTINSSATSLAAGAYYGSIQVSSPNAVDSPQTFEVVLNVVSAAHCRRAQSAACGTSLRRELRHAARADSRSLRRIFYRPDIPGRQQQFLHLRHPGHRHDFLHIARFVVCICELERPRSRCLYRRRQLRFRRRCCAHGQRHSDRRARRGDVFRPLGSGTAGHVLLRPRASRSHRERPRRQLFAARRVADAAFRSVGERLRPACH